MSCRSRRTGSTGSCLHSCGSARVSPRPRAPRRLPRATAPLPRRRTTPREASRRHGSRPVIDLSASEPEPAPTRRVLDGQACFVGDARRGRGAVGDGYPRAARSVVSVVRGVRRSRQIFEWALLSFEATSDDLGLDGNGNLRRATRVRFDVEWGRAVRSRTRKRLAHAPRRRRERRHAASRRVLLEPPRLAALALPMCKTDAFKKLANFDFPVALTRSQPECFWPRRVSGGATQQPLAAARGRDASPLERRGGGVRHGGAPPGVESGQEHRHARRAVRTHLLRSHAIPRPAKDVPSESRRGPSGRPVKRDSLEAHAVEGSRMPSSPRVSSRLPARLSTPRTAATPAAR